MAEPENLMLRIHNKNVPIMLSFYSGHDTGRPIGKRSTSLSAEVTIGLAIDP